jgi:hypothetical protein
MCESCSQRQKLVGQIFYSGWVVVHTKMLDEEELVEGKT